MELLELLWSFVKIGFTSFGGLSMIPLISSEMLSHGWMTSAEVADIVAIAEMTPGPFGLNCATFAGMRVAGLIGAAIANLGILSPTLTVCAVFAVFYKKLGSSSGMQQALCGIRPACLGMVCAVIVSMALECYIPSGTVSVPSLVIGAAAAVGIFAFKLSIPVTIILSAVLGILLM